MQKFKLRIDPDHNELLPYAVISDCNDILNFVSACASEDDWRVREYFYIIGLSRSLEAVFFDVIGVGGLGGVVVDTKLLLCNALLSLSSRVALAHNHPSGSMKASSVDIALTKRLKTSFDAVEIELVDHVILHPNRGEVFSICENYGI